MPRELPDVAALWDATIGRYRDRQTGRFLEISQEATPGDRMPVSSSNLAAIGYDPEAETLEIEFHSGSVYQYDGVPLAVWEGLKGAGSHGQYFHRVIRNVYPYRKM